MKEGIKGIIFDFGGTLDTHGNHWGEVLWDVYRYFSLPVDKEMFRQAYVYGERTLGKQPLIKPDFHFMDTLRTKFLLQLEFLAGQGIACPHRETLARDMAEYADRGTKQTLAESTVLLDRLKRTYRLVLVSNFYGNIRTILRDSSLLGLFDEVIESAVVGVRKPDPAIFALGVSALRLSAPETAVVGDSFTKDIIPAHSLGCHTVWLKGRQWENRTYDETQADTIVTSFTELDDYLSH